MLHLTRVVPAGSADVFAKLEFLNPGGSVKDRAALGMILDAEAKGLLRPGSTIVEATAGNTGVGLALIGVNRGYKVKLFVPEGFAEEKCILMRGFGAEVVRTPEAEGMKGAIAAANKLAEAIPGAFMAGQFTNQANPKFHHDTTGAELWEQMEERVDGFVGGVGTGGTFSGVAQYLKEKNPSIINVAVETQGSILQGGEPGKHRVEGIGLDRRDRLRALHPAGEQARAGDDDAAAVAGGGRGGRTGRVAAGARRGAGLVGGWARWCRRGGGRRIVVGQCRCAGYGQSGQAGTAGKQAARPGDAGAIGHEPHGNPLPVFPSCEAAFRHNRGWKQPTAK